MTTTNNPVPTVVVPEKVKPKRPWRLHHIEGEWTAFEGTGLDFRRIVQVREASE